MKSAPRSGLLLGWWLRLVLHFVCKLFSGFVLEVQSQTRRQ
jgi:hypothetical protein